MQAWRSRASKLIIKPMKLLAGIIVAFGSLFLVFHTRVVDFVPLPEFPKRVDVAKEEVKPISIIFVGDVMLGRGVEVRYKQENIFRNVENIFNQADAVVANLEGPILSNHIKTPNNSYKFSFATTTLDILKSAGFTDLSLANNHTDNSMREGYFETMLNLKGVGLNYFGDPNLISEYSVFQREISGKKFAFAGINDTYGNLSKEKIINLAKDLREKFTEEFLVFFIHWGEEYKTIANSRQTSIGEGLVDAGVDLVIGSHPHVVQNIEKYNDKYIFYSLGNFVFDQYFSSSTQQGLAVNLKIGETGMEMELLPIDLYKSVPEFLTGDKKAERLKEYSLLSDSLKNEIIGGILK